MNNIYIIGVGLIGGSLAIGLRSNNASVTIFGIDANTSHLQEALHLNLIDDTATYNDLYKADLVVLSIPVDKAVIELPKILDHIGEQTLVVDVGSTKLPVCKSVEHHDNRRQFLATHPIAGTEFSGPSAAVPNLFDKKTNIICEVEKTTFKLQEKALSPQFYHYLSML